MAFEIFSWIPVQLFEMLSFLSLKLWADSKISIEIILYDQKFIIFIINTSTYFIKVLIVLFGEKGCQ